MTKPNPWEAGFNDALNGIPANETPHAPYGTAYAFGYSQGQRERNSRALRALLASVEA